MTIDAQRGARLAEERKRLKLSQQAAADGVGIRREMWARYEAGAEPGADVLARMSTTRVDISYVLTGIRADARERLDLLQHAIEIVSMRESDFPDLRMASHSLHRLLQSWLQCKPQNRDAIAELAARLAESGR